MANVLGGEEDYKDAFGVTSPNEPNPDTIASGGTLSVDATTGLGSLIMTSSNTNTGVAGVQTFAVQVVNPGHALITQFDGSATSSGSIDLQSATGITGGNYPFAVSGIDNTGGLYPSWDFGGVFATSTGAGFVDMNDGGTVSAGNAFTSSSGTADSFGRNVVTVSNPAITLATYTVGPEVMRMIDVDTTDAVVGSAYGQGAATFDNASLTAGVFAEIGQWSMTFATVGQFTTDTAGNITAGLADDNEKDNGIQSSGNDITGSTYDLVSSGVNGYGSMTLTNNNSISLLGVYMVDPALNIDDPNNAAADLGGALIVDLSSSGVTPGGMGVITPQTDTTAADFQRQLRRRFPELQRLQFRCLSRLRVRYGGTVHYGERWGVEHGIHRRRRQRPARHHQRCGERWGYVQCNSSTSERRLFFYACERADGNDRWPVGIPQHRSLPG